MNHPISLLFMCASNIIRQTVLYGVIDPYIIEHEEIDNLVSVSPS